MKKSNLGLLALLAGLVGVGYLESRSKAQGSTNAKNTKGPNDVTYEAPVPVVNLQGQAISLTADQTNIQARELPGIRAAARGKALTTPITTVVNADGTVTTFFGYSR